MVNKAAVGSIGLTGDVIGRRFPSPVLRSRDLWMSNGLVPAAIEFMMISRLLTGPEVNRTRNEDHCGRLMNPAGIL